MRGMDAKFNDKVTSRAKGSSFFSAFQSLALSAIAVKILGAVYRIPLANILGTEGLGLYQMIFPIYSLLLILSSSALPSAISKIVAEERSVGNFEGERKILLSARLLLIGGGFIGSVGLYFFSGTIARFQGLVEAELLYKIISPCVLVVAWIALYRGSNQGRLNMKVTATSQLIEQVVKMVVGLILTYIFRKNLIIAVSMAVLSVTISEIATLIYVLIRGSKEQEGSKVYNEDKKLIYLRKLLKQALPMTVAFSVYPVVSLFESKLILQNLGAVDSVAQYGLFSGCVQTVIAIPISLINSFAIALIPTISSKKDKTQVVATTFKITSIIILPFFFALLILPQSISYVLYSRFSQKNIYDLSHMLKLSSVTMLFYALDIYFSGVLSGLGKPFMPMLSQGVGGGVRLALLYYATTNFAMSGVIICSWIGYFVASGINLGYIIIKKKLQLKATSVIATLIYVFLVFGGIFILSSVPNMFLSLIFSVIWVIVCIWIAFYNLRIFESHELEFCFKRSLNEN